MICGKLDAVIERLADLLQFADSLVEQSHFAEGDAEVVVRFGILVGGSNVFFEILLELAEHVGKIDASLFGEGEALAAGAQEREEPE